MTVWTTVNGKPKYGVAIYNYSPGKDTGGPHSLGLQVGELVEISSETDEWYYGRRIAGRRTELTGIFPKSYVNLRDCTVDRTESVEIVSIIQPHIVQEITQTLREWGNLWKTLYVKCNTNKFKFIEVSMRALLELRGAILSGTLPLDQLKKVQRQAIYTMDRGNRELGMDITVRCIVTGVHIDPSTVSTSQLYNLHVETVDSIKQKTELSLTTAIAQFQPHAPPPDSQNQPQSSSTSTTSYSFFASVRNFVCKMSEDAELQLSLYDGTSNTHFTESYVVPWSKGGLAREIDQLHHLRVLFTDLGTSDIKREKVYLVCYVIRIGGMEPQSTDNRRSSVAAAIVSGRSLSQSGNLLVNGEMTGYRGTTMRRPLGVAAMDVTQILSGHLDVDDDKHHCISFFPCEKDNLDSLLRKIISNKELKGDTKSGQGLWVSVKLLHGDLKQIREEIPHLVVGNVVIARKMGFPEVILPSDARNDLYLTLLGGSFTRGVGKSSDRNIQVTVKVCNQDGTTIPGVISLGGGMQTLNEYNSVIYYHEDKPRWHEIFKICVPVEEFKLAHVVFLFKHRSSNEAKDKAEKPFSMSYTPLMQVNGTTLNDIEHNLCVYKVDSKRWPNNDKDAASCYLSLPSQRNTTNGEKDNKLQKGFLSLMPKDSFSISTNVCSTKLTQNVELLGFLNWSDHTSDEKLRQSLIALTTVPKREVVKFLQDILDALFSILTQADVDGSRDTYDFLVFECLLYVISIVLNRKYHHFQPVLELYIKENFCATLAYKKLCKVMSQLVKDADREVENKVLVTSLKCLEYLIRFIVRSRQLHAELTQKSDQHDFQELFQELLNSIVGMMHCETTIVLISQGACLKYLPTSVPHIIQVFPEPLLSKMIGDLLDVLPPERLTKQRLITVLDLVQGPLFLSNQCRCILLPHITKTIKTLIQTSDELELCVRILNEILTLLFRNDIGSTDEEFNHLTLCLLRTIIQATIQMDRENPLMCLLVSVLLEMFRQMTLDRYNIYISMFSSSSELLDFLMEILVVLRDCVEKPVFQKHWADMINLQNNIVLNTLRLLSSTLTESYLQPIETQVWSNWFHLAVVFLTQPSLQLEKLSSSRRRRMTARHGDMRRETAFTVRDMWFKLEDNKIRFLPALVGPFLEMSLLPEVELRKATIPLFFDMMLCEFNNSIELFQDHSRGNFNEFENEMIFKLDVLVEGGSGDAQWSELFVNMVGDKCADDCILSEKGGKFVSTVGRLLDILLQYRDLHDHSSLHYRMQATTTLLGFYSEIKRPEMYIRYVNKLCDLHLDCEDWTEAGLTLHLHAAILHWSNAPLSALLNSHKYPHCQTHRDLKEALCYDIINYLEKGQMWELAVGTCKEMATQYEEEVFDYDHLSELYETMGKLYKAIVKQDRPQPEYFRVGYYGKGFPEFLQNKVFVYRGKEYERLQDFCSRTLNGLPNAELMTTLTPPGDDIKNSNQQYVQVNAVEPLMSDSNERMSGKPISERILKYHQHNNVTKFRFSRPFHRKDEAMEIAEGKSQNEFSTMWLERTELEIREKLPGILRWSIVSKSVTHEMSPLQVAVETMREANKVLKSLVIEHRADPKLPLDPLTRKLNGMVDAAVMGGTANYEKAFFVDEYMKAHPDHKNLINTLKDLIASQIPLLEFGIDVHRVRISSEIAPLHQRIVECFEKMKQHVHENYGKKSCDLEKEVSIVTMRRQRKSMNERGMSFNGSIFNNRLSTTSAQSNPTNESSAGGRQTSLRALTAQFNRGSLSNGLSSGYASLGLPTAAGLRSPVTSLLSSSPAKKRDKEKRRNRKSEASINTTSQPTTPSASSQWYTSSITPLAIVNGSKASLIVSSEPVSSNVVFELRQELTPSRPLRSEVEKEKRLSQRPQSLQSEPHSNRNSAGTTDSNMSAEDDPPPLPQKTVKSEPPPVHHLNQSHRLSSENRVIVQEDENYYQAVNIQVRKPLSANASPVTRRQGPYDTVIKPITPRGSFLYSSLNTGTTVSNRKEKSGSRPYNKERAPTPPPKKRQTPVQI